MSVLEEREELELKLQIKNQWYCDYCGEVIEKPADGMLEWDSILDDENGLSADNFRIVHHMSIKTCKTRRPDDNLADGHLDWYLGPDGLNELLEIQRRYKLDTVKFNIIIRRLHVDLFEEALKYLPLAIEDGYHDYDPYEVGDLSQTDLKWLIKRYGKRKQY
ncbi:hypothetical protein [Brevibacillus sp. FIR094]|uniref:hypothetical protein n=1 Tax=Brevibacillus sp. FIR094 TaxID=3134809 RepID=UPI003D239DD4